jgi:glucose/arabinose dehydrogenase
MRKQTWLLLLAMGLLVSSAAILAFSRVYADSLPNTHAPAGFTLTKVADGLVAPTAAEFAPDGRIFVAQKDGTVKIIKDGHVLPDPFYVVTPVNDYVDRGLLGLALDPNFETNGYVYLLYTYDNNPSNIAGKKTGQLIRVTANGDKAVAGSKKVILGSVVGTPAKPSCNDYPKGADCLVADGLSHAPGTVKFAPDGSLYVSLGEAAGYDNASQNAFRAQDLDSLAGKILHITTDGKGLSSNPFYTGDPTDNRSKVYALGMRNPFRMTVRQSDGQVVTGDVGWNSWEEIDVVNPGDNLGWPCWEADEHQNGTNDPSVSAYKDTAFCKNMYANPPANLTFPVYYYPHPPGSAVVSGVFYSGDNYPKKYQGQFFYGDYAKNKIYSLRLDTHDDYVPNSQYIFASDVGGPVNFFLGPEGDIFYLAINKGAVYHVAYSTANRPPTAVAAASPHAGQAPLSVQFSSDGSYDPDGDTLSYAWDFGDGSPVSDAANPAHTYQTNGKYTVKLTVTDEFNNSDTKKLTIYAGQTAPTVTIDSPDDMSKAATGDKIHFSGSATDAQDGTIPAANLHWQVTIQHCPFNSCHIHNVMAKNGASGSFPYPAHDKPFYVTITLTATDSSGLSSSKTVSVYPDGEEITHSLKFDGLNDYATAAAPQDFELPQFTAEAAIKTLATDTWGGEIMSMGNNWSVRVIPSGGVQFSYWSSGAWQILIADDAHVKDGLWHQVAATKTSSEMKIYVDGKLVAHKADSNPVQYVYGGRFVLGKHGEGDDHFNFRGAIDEVRVWSSPRTDAQVNTYHSSTLPKSERDNLLAYYQMEEGNGGTAADISPSASHNLTLKNGASWTLGMPLSHPGAPTPAKPKAIATLTDNFSGSTIDQSQWNVYQPAANNTAQHDALSVSPEAITPGYYGLASKQRYDLSGSAIYVKVPQTTAADTSAETQLVLEQDGANNITIGFTGNSLLLRHRVGGTNHDKFIAYKPATMKWWRIREANGVIYLETSADGKSWTQRRSFNKAFDISKLKVILQAGTYEPVANPGTAIFDNLNVAPAPKTANYGLSFDGVNGQASTADNQLHFAYQTFTVEAWVKVQDTGVYGSEIVSNGNNWGLRVLPDGNLRFFTYKGDLQWQNLDTTGLSLKDDAWHHVAAVKGSDSVTIYVDGAIVKSYQTTAPVNYTLGKHLVIGRNGAGDNRFNLTGSLDEVRIWDEARTTTELSAHWHSEVPATTHLKGYWQFNDGSGTTVTDTTGNGHPLAISSGASWSGGFPKQ